MFCPSVHMTNIGDTFSSAPAQCSECTQYLRAEITYSKVCIKRFSLQFLPLNRWVQASSDWSMRLIDEFS